LGDVITASWYHPANMPGEPEPKQPRWLSDTLLVAGIPALAYMLTLSYHLGFATAFDIPFQFVSVSWTDAFVVGSILVATSTATKISDHSPLEIHSENIGPLRRE
jgi:hypothetical protein